MKIVKKIILSLCMAVLPLMLYKLDVNAEGTITINVTKTFVRHSYQSGSVIVSNAYKGAEFNVQEIISYEGVTWYKVVLADGETTGYVRGDLVSYNGNGKIVSEIHELLPEETDYFTQIVEITGKTTSPTNLRTLPDAKSDKVTLIKSGTTVNVTGFMQGTDGYRWYYTNLTDAAGTYVGYMREDLIKLKGDIVEIPKDEPEPEPEPEAEPESEPNMTAEPEIVEQVNEPSPDEPGDVVSTEKTETTDTDKKPGKKSILLPVIIAIAVVAAGIVCTYLFLLRKKKNKGTDDKEASDVEIEDLDSEEEKIEE